MANCNTSRKLTTLTLKRKIELIDEVEKKNKKQKTIAEEFGVPANTVSTIVKKRDYYRDLYFGGQTDSSKQRQRGSQHSDVEATLLAWFTNMRASNVPISGPILRTKAEEIARYSGKDDWTCSDSWITRFKKRHNITFKSVCGESGAFDDECVDDWRSTVLSDLLTKYSPWDIYNADETGLFWRMLPDKTMEFKGVSCHGGKQAKERITVLCCANMDGNGSEKWPLFVIGKFLRLRCFKGLRRLPVKYDANRKAWMTASLFESWLLDFDKTMALKGRKVALILDNCVAHPQAVKNLKATNVIFLPPNVTSKLQPCDMGIIGNLKTFYRAKLLKRLIQHVDSGEPFETFKPTLLDAVGLLKTSWSNVEPSTIINCFRKAGFIKKTTDPSQLATIPSSSESSDTVDTDKIIATEIEPLLSRLYNENQLSVSSVSALDFVGVDEVITSPLDSSTAVGGEEDREDGEEDDVGQSLPDVKYQTVTASLQNVSTYMMQRECSDEIANTLAKRESSLEAHHHTTKIQRKISDFFSSK